MAFAQELAGTRGEAIQVMLVRAEAEPQHLYLHLLGVGLLLLFLLLELVEVVAELADLHHRRHRLGRHLDEVESLLLREGNGFGDGHHLGRAVIGHQHHLGNADLVVDAGATFLLGGFVSVTLTQKREGGRTIAMYEKCAPGVKNPRSFPISGPADACAQRG